MDKQETICLIDGSGYIFRAFYALPMMTRSDGTPVNAVYGFLNMLLNLSFNHQLQTNLTVTISQSVPTRIGMPQLPTPDVTITWGLCASFL